MVRYFCSDHHLDHANIIKYSSRPFKDTLEMGDRLLELHNNLVKSNDHVSFLGDVSILRGGRVQRERFIRQIKKYNGHKRLYLGNHDHFPIRTYLDAGFEKIYATWRDEKGIIFSHFPIHPRSIGSAIACVHGHTHLIPDYEPVMVLDKITQKVSYRPYINICVEQTGYAPISYDELMARIDKARGGI